MDRSKKASDSGVSEKYKIDEEKESQYTRQLKLLLNESIDLREAAERGDIDCIKKTTDILKIADEVLQDAQSSSSAYLDAQILHTSSHIFKNLVEKMDSQLSEFRAKEFAEHTVLHLEGKAGCQNMFTVLDDESVVSFNNTGGWSWLLGAIDEEEDVPGHQRTKRRRTMTVDVPMKNPVKVVNHENPAENLEAYFNYIHKLVEEWDKAHKTPLQFWDFVLHPTSFAETVENIFHVSHLVKEGQIYLQLDRNGLPTIKAIPKKEENHKTKVPIDRVPVAISLNREQWEELVQAFEIVCPMIPARISDAEP